MPSTSHFHGNNIDVNVYRGFCEVINDHYHPVFLLLYIDQQQGKFWISIEILNNEKDHFHNCEISNQDIEDFMSDGELTSVTEKSEEIDHRHKLHFNIDHRQGLTVDPLSVLFGKKTEIENNEDQSLEDS